ncbi:hypothetical protein LOTGIDRAFT_113794 [Lottia gigantea]|uniref:Uncharacterized protein n=1 Tax=Lottia gigantea TaxID=225164 RepID=V4CAX9_LOTGI|nr:hypothetical protein LOTGIDRAFT_113794 [Lottia gigantea]ESO98984.1 hypothetical protein LOTGIDRAFT_113794 [Lottia gigantea]
MTFISERDRLETFRTWPPLVNVYPVQLVQAGFHYTGTDDAVACSFCNGAIRNWKHRKDPISEHQKLSPNCLYIREYLKIENSPKSAPRINVSDDSNLRNPANSNESILVNPTQIHVACTSQKRPLSQTLSSIQRPSSHSHITSTHSHTAPTIQNPFVHYYTKEEHRLKSFIGWNGQVDPRQLAHAGLYYLGNSDRVQCFSCQTIFRDWVAGDDPWIEHSKWYPDCPYIQLCLGKDVVKEIHEHMMRRRENRTHGAFDDVVEGSNLVF